MNVHIVGYGGYIPRWRIKGSDIAHVYNISWEKMFASNGVMEKSVPGMDEDAATMGVEASWYALKRANIKAQNIQALFVGSESHPYAVKPTATIIAQALGVNRYCYAADLEFACKAGTAALITAASHVGMGVARYGLAIGSDTAQAAPGDVLEYTAAAGSAAFILGQRESESLACIEATCSVTSDTPDFWRRAGKPYPEHAGRFTAQPAYFAHVLDVAQELLRRLNIGVSDIDHVVFHQPNGRFPVVAAKKLGFSSAQFSSGLLAPYLGNAYSASSLLGLCSVLDHASAGQRVLLVSYGSGSGADALLIKTTPLLIEQRGCVPCIQSLIDKKEYVDYTTYWRVMQEVAHK